MSKNPKKKEEQFTQIEVIGHKLSTVRRSCLSSEKDRITLQLPKEVIERVKNAVFWTPGLTITELATEALSMAVDILEEERGERFETKSRSLRSGRPIKAR